MTFHPDSGAVTGVYLLVHDQVGSVVRTLDVADGSAVESVEYDAWGVATVSPGGNSVHPFGFAGGLWDRRTGLLRFGAREYDAGLGRWLARDPIGFGGGWNHCGYAGGDPVGRVDPDGLNPLMAGWALVLAQGAAAGAAVDTTFQLSEMAFGDRAWGDFDWWRVGEAAGSGAATGGLMRWFFPPAPAMICPPPVDAKFANIANHIFGPKSFDKHNLGELLRQYGGDPISAAQALQSAAQKLADAGTISGVFNTTVIVGGHAVNVKGNVINGVVNMSTAFAKSMGGQ